MVATRDENTEILTAAEKALLRSFEKEVIWKSIFWHAFAEPAQKAAKNISNLKTCQN